MSAPTPAISLDLDDSLSLTCTRSGSCCFGHRIAVTPWEIAILARHLDISQRLARDQYTHSGGMFLRFDPAEDGTGPKSCSFFRKGPGCTVHPARPLACRVYPLARRRDADRSYFTFAGDTNQCLTRCPDIKGLPRQKVGTWLAQQEIGPGQAAHDAYGNLVWGMVITSANIAASGGLDIDLIASEASRRVILNGDERIPFLPPPWYDLLTIPELPVDLDDAAMFVEAHARRLQQAISNNFALPPTLEEIALLVVTMAIHLSPCVGIDPAAAVLAFAAVARERSLTPVG